MQDIRNLIVNFYHEISGLFVIASDDRNNQMSSNDKQLRISKEWGARKLMSHFPVQKLETFLFKRFVVEN